MSTIAPGDQNGSEPKQIGENESDGRWEDEQDFVPLTREQAQKLRTKQAMLSPWKVIGWQLLVAVVVTTGAWWVTGKDAVAYSVLYGAMAVVIPAALFARGMTSKVASVNPGAAVFGFFLWEMVKIALTVAMMFAAPRLVTNLSWPAMLVGLVVTMKVYWVALWVRPGNKVNNSGN